MPSDDTRVKEKDEDKRDVDKREFGRQKWIERDG